VYPQNSRRTEETYMSESNLIDTLRTALQQGDAVIRLHADLEPAADGKLLPPTYAGGSHNLTPPRPDGSSAWCSLDSPASVANRLEAALAATFPELAPLRVRVGDVTLSTLQLPHRLFDAILRESQLNGTLWLDTDIAKAVQAARPETAYPLLQWDPALLLLGGWDSTKLGRRTKAVREAKYPAALSCEIVATDVIPINRAGSRIDPLGIEGTESSLVEHEDGRLEAYDADAHGELPVRGEKENNTYPRRVKPSQVNLGNVAPGLTPKGVLVRGSMTLHGVLDLRRLARYRFAPADDIEARLLLALMGLFGIDAVWRRGLDLRRDCELVATSATASLLRFGGVAETLDLSQVATALKAQIAGLREHLAQPVELTGNTALSSLVA
jgi:CRISPR-associated protein Csb1